MSPDVWRLDGVELASKLRRRELSAREAIDSTLTRINELNPQINALTEVMDKDARVAAMLLDEHLARGGEPGPLHGVPITVKINIDVEGYATTDGVVAQRENVVDSDSPAVANLRRAGAVIVGRSNAPAFSLRWFTDNALHGRTLNPFDSSVTPGGSSGGAAAAVATGMGAIGLGTDLGGSIRYPALACGVVGLRTTVGRVPSYKPSSPRRSVTNQMMATQGPITRTVRDARLALKVMSGGSAFDPQWVDARIEYPKPDRALRIAVFNRHGAYDADVDVVTAVDEAALLLSKAGCEVVQAEPPHFEEAADLWRQLVNDDMRRGAQGAVERFGDADVKVALQSYFHELPGLDRDETLERLSRRFDIARDWSVFLDTYDVLLMPVSWQRQFPLGEDIAGPERVYGMLRALSPALGTAMLGLPALAVPTSLVKGLPMGVQMVATRFREDRCLAVGETLEAATKFSAIDHLVAIEASRTA